MSDQTIERQRMDADIVCVGFGPATAGFLATLSKQLTNADGMPAVESAVMPGMPPQQPQQLPAHPRLQALARQPHPRQPHRLAQWRLTRPTVVTVDDDGYPITEQRPAYARTK